MYLASFQNHARARPLQGLWSTSLECERTTLARAKRSEKRVPLCMLTQGTYACMYATHAYKHYYLQSMCIHHLLQAHAQIVGINVFRLRFFVIPFASAFIMVFLVPLESPLKFVSRVWAGLERPERALSLLSFMRGLYYHFSNLRFNNWLNNNYLSIPISSVFLCLKAISEM